MGSSKLMLPWPLDEHEHQTVADVVLKAWTTSQVDKVVIIVRGDDSPLVAACARWPVDVVQVVEPTRDMKASIRVGLRHIESCYRPTQQDWCFVAPADLPTLNKPLIDQLQQSAHDPTKIVVPVFGDCGPGHPVLLPWKIAQSIHMLAEDQGLDQLLRAHPQHHVALPANARVKDVDTPAEYDAALAACRSNTHSS
ncbi:MAG: NTP transferase domain-containing protein [Planctomycetales bacterium]|nr:NTP transferase domain-containing protein [Planctomycetales bacterium]